MASILRCATIGALALGLSGLGVVTEASAATLTVNTTNMNIVNDSNCGLREAIKAVNDQTNTAGCTGLNYGVNDTILLAATTYTASTPLEIFRSVIIGGAGVGQTIVRGNLTSGGEVFYVGPAPGAAFTSVSFQDLTLNRASGQAVPQVTGIFAHASESEHALAVSVERCRITGHSRGAIFGAGVSIVVVDSTIDGNTSVNAGGGISVSSNGTAMGETNVLHSTISGNYSSYSGGGIYHAGEGNSHIRYSTVSGNSTAGNGGGVWLDAVDSYFQIDDSTIAHNHASNIGGGVYATGYDEKYWVFRTIIANNTSTAWKDWDGHIANIEDSLLRENLADIGTEYNNLYGVDPMLDSTLRDMGGPYRTKVHRLLAGSPAIDHHAAADSEDQRHFNRTIGSAADIGAFEYDANWQTESLRVAGKSGDVHAIVGHSGYFGSKGTNLDANAVNDYVTYEVPVVESGTYNVRVRVRRGSDRGKFRLARSDSAAGTFTDIGSEQNPYATTTSYTELNLSSSVSLTAGMRYFRFKVTGTSSPNSGANNRYDLFLDTIKLTKVP